MGHLIDRPKWDRGPGKEHRDLLDALAEAFKTRDCQLELMK